MAGREENGVHPLAGADTGCGERRIRVLPQEVADQIAAGEVVERPASVVKELVENALDAGARHIVVEVEGGGSARIAVVDDGEGMSSEDAPAAFLRHATSKVMSASDLERIVTLGFRGEALASIAAVSRVVLFTRRREDFSGTRVDVEYGRVVDVRAAGTPVGTRVEVADLFGNTPARRKFLKAPATETAHITEFVTRTALAWPQVGFVLRHGERTLAEFPAVAEQAERVGQVFGPERARGMLSLAACTPVGRVYGWVSEPRQTFPSQRQIYIYVNRRHVRDKLVTHAVIAGYSTLLMHGRYPGAAIFLELPPEEVDVNVHPAKFEVRFRHGGAVHELISRAVLARLREQSHERPEPFELPAVTIKPAAQIPVRDFGAIAVSRPPSFGPLQRGDDRIAQAEGAERLPGVGPATGRREGERLPGEEPMSPVAVESGAGVASDQAAAPQAFRGVARKTSFFSSMRVVGQVFNGYLVCEEKNGLVLIDQHAAHERVTFESLRAAYSSGSVPRQKLLIPVIVEVGPREAALIGERVEELEALGFEIDSFGGSSFSVRAVPALLGDCDPAALLRDVSEELAEVGRLRRLTDAVEAVLARLACHSAVRFGQNLSPAQIRALLVALDGVDFSGHCPHGRPAFIHFPLTELERWFRRT